MLNNLQYNYTDLFKDTRNPNELPDLRSNKHLVKWMCKKYNEFLAVKNTGKILECRVNYLLKTYGPDNESVKRNLGGRDFYF